MKRFRKPRLRNARLTVTVATFHPLVVSGSERRNVKRWSFVCLWVVRQLFVRCWHQVRMAVDCIA